MRLLISGGPGSGCTSTGEVFSERLGIPVFDSDTFLFVPTNPPYQKLQSHDERRRLLMLALEESENWIISGSIATWDIDFPFVHFGIFMNTPKAERLQRLELRERKRFGSRIDAGGDMHIENSEFMEWASKYEDRVGEGRNRCMDRDFLIQKCNKFIEINPAQTPDKTASKIRDFLTEPPQA